ncbi:MAG: cation transporter [Cyclobacteriaceae bacterium]|nr:cation transporter [Cyclobacteriaceae bacterium]
MGELKLKTNIKCDACVAKVTPYLNEVAGKDSWQVDLKDPARVLIVNTEAPAEKVIEALQKAGYKGEAV